MKPEDIQKLQSEKAPDGLSDRIVARLMKEASPKVAARRPRRLLLATAATALAALVVVGALSSRPASAAKIEDVRAAFCRPLAYTINSYQIINGERRKVGRTEVDGDKTKIVIIGPDGREQDLAPMLQQLSQNLDRAIASKSPSEIAQPGALKDIYDESSQDLIGEIKANAPEGVSIQQIDPAKLSKELQDLVKELEKLVKELEKVDKATAKGAGVWGGETGAQYTRQLLSDSDLWDRQPDTTRNGQVLNHFRLKGGFQNLDLYVDPVTRLPIVVRMDLSFGDFPLIVEDEYDYRAFSTQP